MSSLRDVPKWCETVVGHFRGLPEWGEMQEQADNQAEKENVDIQIAPETQKLNW